MSQDSIKCPNCGMAIPLSEALSHDIEERARQKYEAQLAEGKKQFETVLNQKETEYASRLANEKKNLAQKEQELEDRLKKQLAASEAKLKRQAEEAMGAEVADLKNQVEDNKKKLKQAQDNELNLRKKKRELEEKEKSLELELARRVDEERKKIEQTALSRYEQEHKLKDAEKDKRLADALTQVEELKRKMEQGSQKMQGEILELELEDTLRSKFPFDLIESVAPGKKGADVIQTVKSHRGNACGKILWETKRTRNWNDAWIQKLKDNMRDAKTDIAVLVSETLPEGFFQFREMEPGIWVADLQSYTSLATALRVVITQVAHVRETQMGKQDKMELVYSYLTGAEFKNRVTAIIEAFRAMKNDLDAERTAMQRIWDKREKQIEKVISNTAGMYGDLEGLAGASLPPIKVLEFPSEDTNPQKIT